MEDYAIDIVIGKGAGARSIRLDLPKFTLVGATTRAGMLTAPLRDRFGVVHHLEFYTVPSFGHYHELRRRAGGGDRRGGSHGAGTEVPGNAPACKPSPQAGEGFRPGEIRCVITKAVADFALDLLDVDKYGLDHIDRNILLT